MGYYYVYGLEYLWGRWLLKVFPFFKIDFG